VYLLLVFKKRPPFKSSSFSEEIWVMPAIIHNYQVCTGTLGNLRLDGDENNVHPVVRCKITKDRESSLRAYKVNTIAEGIATGL
jgi:hypothetical protein